MDATRDIQCFVGMCPKCGHWSIAVVNDGNNVDMVAQALAEAARDKLVIQILTVGWVRDHANEMCFGNCDAPKQAAMFGEVMA